MSTKLDQSAKNLKDRYGENFMHFCRSNLSTYYDSNFFTSHGLDKKFGWAGLYDVIYSMFEPSKELLSDITKNHLEEDFIALVSSTIQGAVGFEETAKTEKSPFELMREAGYTLYHCKTKRDVERFRNYYDEMELLCTYNEVDERLKTHEIFFAVKDGATPFNEKTGEQGGIDGKGRFDFLNPQREDEYSTSVLSLQFKKGEVNPVSIKSRYNHGVKYPDSTFSNNLEKLCPGLTYAFAREFGFEFGYAQGSAGETFQIPNYVYGDGKFIKFNKHFAGKYFCPGNISVADIDNSVTRFDKSQFELVDHFLIDKVNRTVVDETGMGDSFCDALTGFQKLKIVNLGGGERRFVVTMADGNEAAFVVDKDNQILSYTNEALKSVGNGFMAECKSLESVDLPNLEEVGDNFLYQAQSMKQISLPKLKRTGEAFMKWAPKVTEVNLPEVEELGKDFMGRNLCLRRLDLPHCKRIEPNCLSYNQMVEMVNLPEAEEIERNLLSSLVKEPEINIPNAEFYGQQPQFLKDYIRHRDLMKDNQNGVKLPIGNGEIFVK